MQRILLKSLAILTGATLHHLLFWQTGLGLNTLVFAVITLSLVFAFHPELSRSHSVIALTGGTIVAAIAVVLSHTAWSKGMYLLSFTLLIGAVQQRELRFLFYAFLLGLISWILVPVQQARDRIMAGKQNMKWVIIERWAKRLFLPIVVFGLFLIVYSQASLQLSNILEHISEYLLLLVDWEWPIASLIFFIFGVGIVSSLLFPSSFGAFFAQAEKKWGLNLIRRRPDRKQGWHRRFSMLALRNEYWIAVLVVGMLNGLLLLVNLLDFRYVWWPPTDPSPQELSQFVHKGTSMLILAILMAMGVLMVFFRRNLNFLSGNQLLKKLSYLWIFQNGFLALSVAIRNFHYIQHYGLTHKRLGVLLFLALVIFGLITLYAKIRFPKTIYFLLLLNAWVVYVAFLCFGSMNWDVFITRYNIKHPPVSGIDEYYLYSLSDDNTYLLLKHQDRLIKLNRSTENNGRFSLKSREARLRKKLDSQDWREWNWADERNKRYLR